MDATLDLTGFAEIEKILTELPDISLKVGEYAMEQTMIYLLSILPPYPDKPEAGLAARLWSPAQRAAFFAHLKELQAAGFSGERTGELGQKFTTTVRRDTESVEGEIGTSDPKAPWVVGPDYPGEEINGEMMYQARIHAGRWWQFMEEIEKAYPQAMQIFQEKFFERLGREWTQA